MRTLAGVLGIVGGAMGILGGLVTIVVGSLFTFVEFIDQLPSLLPIIASLTTIGLGAVAVALSLAALIAACFINRSAKGVSVFLIIAGVLCILCTNVISGFFILLGGILGVSSRPPQRITNC